MKANILAILLAVALLFSCAALAESESTPADPASMVYESKWVNDQGDVDIWYEEEGFRVAVTQTAQGVRNVWEYSCLYDQAAGTLNAVSCLKTHAVLDDMLEPGEAVTDYDVLENTATFAIDENGRLTWADTKEDAGKGLAFDKIGHFEGAWLCDRAEIEILWDVDRYVIQIHWAGSAFEAYDWNYNGTYDADTHNAVVAFQQRNGLVISGIADALTRQVLHGGAGKPYSTPVQELPANEGWINGPAVSELKLLHWQNEIKPTVKAGQTFTVFDPNTHLSWKLVFYSLGRHADSQPASWRDTQIMNRSFGGTSWNIHPVYVQLPSGQWTLATMHNRPHLYGTITDNGFGGHLCVHFLRDMAEAQKNDPNYGVNNQVTLRNAWKALTGQTVD